MNTLLRFEADSTPLFCRHSRMNRSISAAESDTNSYTMTIGEKDGGLSLDLQGERNPSVLCIVLLMSDHQFALALRSSR